MAMVLALTFGLGGNAGAVYLTDGSVQNGTTGLLNPVRNYCVATPASYTGTGSIPNAVERDDLSKDSFGAGSAASYNPSACTSSTAVGNAIKAAFTTNAACTAAGYRWKNTEPSTTNTQPLTAGTVTAITAGSCSSAFWTGDIPGTTGTSTSGMQWYTYSNDGCLRCHNAQYMALHNAPQADKTSYLMTGHRNMLRKVTAGENWAGPNGVVYTTDGTNTINFGTGTVTLASNGTTHQLFYIYGDWMAANPTLLYNTTSDGVTSNGYSCAPCHTTGFGNYANSAGSCTNFNYTTAATCASGGGTWVYATGVLYGGASSATATGAQPQATYPGITGVSGNWDVDAIRCSRCHSSSNPGLTDASGKLVASGHNNTPSGTAVTNLCFGCHQSASSKTYSSPSDTTGTVQTDPTLIPTGAGHGAAYARDFNGHVIGNEFLNGVHGLYTGTMLPNELGERDLNLATGTFASFFSSPYAAESGSCSVGTFDQYLTSTQCSTAGGTWTSEAGSCVACHDVHQSMVASSYNDGSASSPVTVTATPLKRYCTTCHAGQYAQTKINHPSGPGTPMANYGSTDAQKASACIICHMSLVAVANGTLTDPMHVFRINTSSSYNTFPTMKQFYGGSCSVNTAGITSSTACTTAGGTWTAVTKQIMANTQTDPGSGYTNAVWVDLDNACGQCHGGGYQPYTTTGSVTKGSTALTAGSTSGLTMGVGAQIVVAGAGANGADLWTVISAISGNTITLSAAASTTVSGAEVRINATANGAPYMTKAELSRFAKNMHSLN